MSATRISLRQASSALKAKAISSTELVQQCLSRLGTSHAKQLNAFVSVWNEESLKLARESDLRWDTGNQKSDIDGIPIAVKDNFCSDGDQTTCASNILKGFVSPYDATVVKLLKDAGAIIIGKTNMDEFGMGSANTFSCHGAVLNPWNKNRVAGGSSGGSAAAVSSYACFGALGSDTGGSVRLPGAYCGVVGLKPTYGLLSRHGLVSYASSLDVPGIITRKVEDSAILLDILANEDANDSTNRERAKRSETYLQSSEAGIKGLKIGIPDEYFVKELPSASLKLWKSGIEWLEKAGAEIHRVQMPHTKYALPSYYILAPAEASSNLARYGGVNYGLRSEGANTIEEVYTKTRTEGFGDEVKRRLFTGAFVLSRSSYESFYVKAQQVRRLIRQDFEHAFDKVDVLLTPTTTSTARPLQTSSANPVEMYMDDVMTVPASLAGVPAITVPTGLSSKDRMPLGLQLIAADFCEEKLLRTAKVIEDAAAFPNKCFRGD